VTIEEHRMGAVDAQSLPNAVPEDEPGIEHGDHGFGAWLELAVHPDEDVDVAAVLGVLMCPMSGLLDRSSAGAEAHMRCRPFNAVTGCVWLFTSSWNDTT
jgi:hypothetical protein